LESTIEYRERNVVFRLGNNRAVREAIRQPAAVGRCA
jgi:hypothetical protein